jgi:hypothetical protein
MPSQNLLAFTQLAKEVDDDLTSEKSLAAMEKAVRGDAEYVQPPSLPHGGIHKGRDGWIEMQRTMRSFWNLDVNVRHMWDIEESDVVILYVDMEWTAKSTGRSVQLPALELLQFQDGKLARTEIFLQDTKALLDTLVPVSR